MLLQGKMEMKMKLFYAALLVIGSNHLFAHAMHDGVLYEIEKVPYVAQLTLNYERGFKSFCGAAILSERWILTAADCIVEVDEGFLSAQVRIGSSETLAGGKLFDISKVINHEEYSNETRWISDISLIELAEPIEFNDKSQPIAISKTSPKVKSVITLTGYGYDKDEPIWDLQVGHQTVVSRKECREAYKSLPQGNIVIDDRVFCADSTAVDGGFGDAGSPAVLNGKVVGIAVEANEAPIPNIYVDVSYYYDWISDVTGINFD